LETFRFLISTNGINLLHESGVDECGASPHRLTTFVFNEAGTVHMEMALPGRGHSPLRNQEQLQEDDEDEERSHFACETEIDDQVLRLRSSGLTPTPEQIASFSAFDLYFDSEFSNSSPSRIISNRFECLFYDGIVHCFRCGTTWEEMLMKLVRGVTQSGAAALLGLRLSWRNC
jgi:hypothetical protein